MRSKRSPFLGNVSMEPVGSEWGRRERKSAYVGLWMPTISRWKVLASRLRFDCSQLSLGVGVRLFR